MSKCALLKSLVPASASFGEDSGLLLSYCLGLNSATRSPTLSHTHVATYTGSLQLTPVVAFLLYLFKLLFLIFYFIWQET